MFKSGEKSQQLPELYEAIAKKDWSITIHAISTTMGV
jgi:hypothetical protein